MSKGSSIWSLPFVALMVANFFLNMSSFVAHTTLPVYVHALGAPTALVGFASGGFALTALFVRPFAGPAFDSFSRKWLLVLSLGIVGVAFVLFGVSAELAPIIAIRLLQGVGIGCAGPLAMSLVSEYLPASKFSSGISVFALSQSFAQVVGPAFGLFLYDTVGFSLMCFIAAVSLALAILSILFVKEPYRETLPYELKLDRMFARASVPAAMATLLLATAFSCSTAYVVLYGQTLGVDNVGIYFSIYAACLLLTRPIFGKLSDRLGAPRMLLVGVAFFVSSYVALHFAHDFGGFVLAAVLGSAGYGSCMPLLQALALMAVPVERRGAASNTTYIGLDLGTLCGPVIGGTAAQIFLDMTGSQAMAYSDMWIVMLVPIFAALVIILYWNLRPERARA